MEDDLPRALLRERDAGYRCRDPMAPGEIAHRLDVRLIAFESDTLELRDEGARAVGERHSGACGRLEMDHRADRSVEVEVYVCFHVSSSHATARSSRSRCRSLERSSGLHS